MKILIVSDLYPLIVDSTIPSVVEGFALAFKKRVEKVVIIRPNFLLNTFIRKHKIIKSGEYLRNGIKIYNRNFILPFIFEDEDFISNFKDFDLIISHMPSGHIYADLLNKRLNLPHIAIVHQSDFEVITSFKYCLYFKKRLKKALYNCSSLGARNKFLAEYFNCDFILPSFVYEKNIIKTKIFKNKKIKFITLSKLIKRKNINLVIEALKSVDFDFEYDIYGEGRQKNELQNLILKLNLQDKIKIHNFINHNEIYEKLDESDIFILPSIKESFGVAFFEAMSRGLIVIAGIDTGMDGIIRNDENGYLVEPDVKSVFKVLSKLKEIDFEDISRKTIETIRNFEEGKIMTKYFENIKKNL